MNKSDNEFKVKFVVISDTSYQHFKALEYESSEGSSVLYKLVCGLNELACMSYVKWIPRALNVVLMLVVDVK